MSAHYLFFYAINQVTCLISKRLPNNFHFLLPIHTEKILLINFFAS